MAKSSNYDASNITVLEGLEAVRRRPGMYIGSVSTKGLNHLIYEIMDNSVDEHLAGFCDRIEVILEADGSGLSLQRFMREENLIMMRTRPAAASTGWVPRWSMRCPKN